MLKPIAKKIKQIISYTLLGLSIGLPVSMGTALAGTASFQLNPNQGSYSVGDYLTVEVIEDSGDVGVNAVQADLQYDSSVLQFQSIDASQSDFPSEMPVAGGGGVVSISRAILGDGDGAPPVVLKNTKLVALVTFKVIAPSASSKISFANTSSIKEPKDPTTIAEAWNGVTMGATFSFQGTGGGTSNGGGGGTTGGTGSGGGSSTSSGGKSSAKPKTTSGTKAGTKIGASTAPPATSTTKPLEQTDVSTDSGPQLLTPTRHMVTIKVVDSNGKPVVGAEVKMNGETTHSLSNGSASFVGIADGDYRLSIKYKGKTETRSITVKADGQPSSSVQNFKVKLSASQSLPNWIKYTVIGLAILFILGFFIPRGGGRAHRKFNYTNAISPDSVVVGSTSPKTAPTVPAPPVVQQPQPAAPLPQQQKAVTPGTFIQPTEKSGAANNDQQNNINKDQ